MSYQSKDSNAFGRQLKTQRLVIPFQIVGHATPASKTQASDEPAVLFIRTEGIDGITTGTGALDASETITYVTAAADSTGIVNLLVRTGASVSKVCRASVFRRSSDPTEAAATYSVQLGDADGLTSTSHIALTFDGSVALTSGTHNLCLDVEYIEAE